MTTKTLIQKVEKLEKELREIKMPKKSWGRFLLMRKF